MTNLDRTWKNCLRMWKWVSESWERKKGVTQLKRRWLQDNGFVPEEFHAYCFFCEYAGVIEDDDGDEMENCKACPAAMIETGFVCDAQPHSYMHKPKAFYRKLLALDKKRRQKHE